MASTYQRPTRVRIGDASDSIRRRDPFIAGDGLLSGGPVTPEDVTRIGRLPYEPANYQARYVTACVHAYRSGAGLYVVRSCGTPIAWAGPGEPLTVPAVRYNVTTSRHQRIARRADA